MAKQPINSKPRDAYPKPPAKSVATVVQANSHAIRETVESIVIAFVLAFLFRTFEAEAFVIPTGSMAPTLMGRHKDVYCPKCGHRFRVSASEEEGDELEQIRGEIVALQQEIARQNASGMPDSVAIRRLQSEIDRRVQSMPGADVVGGVCPICRYTMPMRPDLPGGLPVGVAPGSVVDEPSYNGDRILVNKYIYTVSDPQRWDVVVFKFPGNAQINYIKRLVGKPGEHLRIFQGNLFIGGDGAKQQDEFKIARKPPETILAMRQLVHDTNYDPSELYNAGWPLRWQPADGAGDSSAWKTDAKADSGNVQQRFSVDASGDQTAWLRYRHQIPDFDVWHQLGELEAQAKDHPNQPVKFSDAARATWRPQLITDFNAYNTRITRGQDMAMHELRASPDKLGIHWVSDLMVEADVDVEASQGALLLDLVEGGKHLTATIDLATGQATLSIDGLPQFAPTAGTPLSKPGRYHVALSNFDDELLLWIDGRVVKFDGDTAFDAAQIFGSRDQILPQTSPTDPGDLAPAGIGAAKGAKLTVSRLQMWRDIYYIADSWQDMQKSGINLITDFENVDPRLLISMARDPSLWHLYSQRRFEDFMLGPDQFFVMGDNSPESSDARLWGGQGRTRGHPGGAYLERQLLIGKALCVYWPHSWNRIPGTPIPFPLFPNFMDMRLVR
jgi:signal peptidase I